jgi:HrpA-like RNA helicase
MTKYVLEQDSRYARRDFQEDVDVISATEGRHRTVKTVSSVEKVVARIDPAKVNDELIETLIIHLKPTLLVGCTVLVFLPGTASISRLYSRLSSLRIFSKKDKIIKLHSTASKASIRDAFAQCSGVRIVLSTNIAETGVTLPNVNVVIDTGRVKQIAFNERKGIKSLIERFVSKASAKQRAGRAGRVMRGRCYRLYPEDLYENTFVAFDKPEILRTPIDSLLLQVMIGGETRPIHFFESAVDPPERSKIRAASLRLRGLGLIEISSDDNEFTIKLEDLGSCRVLPLGIACARVPTDLKVAKFLLTASLLGHDVLESAAVLAATLESRNPFLSPSEKRNEADVARSKFNADAHSDSLSVLHAFEAWNQNKRSKKFCKKNFLSPLALLEISKTRDHLLKSIEKSGFIGSSTSFSRDIDKRDRLLRACLVSAFFPNIVAVEKPRECDKTRTWIKRDGSHVYMHPSSLNHSNRLSEMHVAGRTMLWCVFVEFFKTSREFIRDSTLCEAMSCALLCGGERRIIHTKHRLIVDDWMEFAASARTASIIKRLSVMFQDLFRERLRTVESDGDVVDKSCDVSSSRSSGGDSVLDLVVEILSEKPSEDVIFNRGI